MVLAARKRYSDTVAWMRSRVPPRRDRASLAWRSLGGTLTGSLLLLGVIGVLSPARFGSQGSRAFGSGWPTIALVALVAASGAWAVARRRTLAWLIARAREPWRRPLTGEPAFDGAAGSLASVPGSLQTRFALSWVWGPAAAALLAGATCLSAGYFVIDAILARGEVGWQQPVLAAANLALAWIALRASAGRLAVWPLAVAVHRDATGAYS